MTLKHIFFYAIARGGPGALNFLALAIYTRLLTTEDFGSYSIAMAYIGLVHVGLYQALLLVLGRFLPSSTHNARDTLGHCISLFLIISIITLAIGVLLSANAESKQTQIIILLSAFLVCVNAWHEMNLRINSALLEPLQYGILSFLKATIALVTGTGLCLIGVGVNAPLFGLILGSSVAWLLVNSKHFLDTSIKIPDQTRFKEYFSYGGPLSLTFILAWFVTTSDRVFIGWILGPEYTGIYSAGYDLAHQTLMLTLTIVSTATLPLAIKALETSGLEAARKQMKLNGEILFMICLSCAAFLISNQSLLINLIIGESFREGAEEIFPIIVMSASIAGIKIFYFDIVYNLSKEVKQLVLCALITAASSVTLNIVLIPKYGIFGASLSALITMSIACTYSAIAGRYLFKLPNILPMLAGSTLSGATIFLGCSLLGNLQTSPPVELILNIGFTAATFFLFCLAFDTCDSRTQMTRVIRKILRDRPH